MLDAIAGIGFGRLLELVKELSSGAGPALDAHQVQGVQQLMDVFCPASAGAFWLKGWNGK